MGRQTHSTGHIKPRLLKWAIQHFKEKYELCEGQVPFKKYIRRHNKNKEVVINLSSKNGNSLVRTEKNSGKEQLHSYAPRTLKLKEKHTKAKITLKNAFH